MWKLPRFMRKKTEPAHVLPTYVVDELEALSVLVRGRGSAEEAPVVYITMAGPKAPHFRFYSDTVEDSVRSIWPELNDNQVRRAARWITAQVHNQMRERAGTFGGLKRRRNWATDYTPPSWE